MIYVFQLTSDQSDDQALRWSKKFFLTNQAACLNKTKNTDRVNVQGKQEGSDKIRGECHEEENHASRLAKN